MPSKKLSSDNSDGYIIVNLSRDGHHAQIPMLHDTLEEAKAEAERLGGLCPKQRFEVLRVSSVGHVNSKKSFSVDVTKLDTIKGPFDKAYEAEEAVREALVEVVVDGEFVPRVGGPFRKFINVFEGSDNNHWTSSRLWDSREQALKARTSYLDYLCVAEVLYG